MNNTKMILISGAACVFAMLSDAEARAHITFGPGQAAAGGYYVGELRVTHGCAGAATTALRVEIPASVATAKPQPKAGWTLTTERQPLVQPVRSESGAVVRDRLKAVVWRGRLPENEFETFGLMLRAPTATGLLYFPAVQTCEGGETRWTDIPAPGQAWHSVPHPAPVLKVVPAADDGMAGMDRGR